MADSSPPTQGRVLYIVSSWVPNEQLAEWNRWHTEVHLPVVLAHPQIRRARKYRVVNDTHAAQWTPQYVTVYELDSLADWDSYSAGPAATVRAHYEARYGAVGKLSRQVLVEEVDLPGTGG